MPNIALCKMEQIRTEKLADGERLSMDVYHSMQNNTLSAQCEFDAFTGLRVGRGINTPYACAYYEIYPDRIEIILTDEGPGIADIDLAMQAGYSTAPDNIRSLGFGAGMGLPNMKSYTDEMTIESTVGVGTKIMMTVYVK